MIDSMSSPKDAPFLEAGEGEDDGETGSWRDIHLELVKFPDGGDKASLPLGGGYAALAREILFGNPQPLRTTYVADPEKPLQLVLEEFVTRAIYDALLGENQGPNRPLNASMSAMTLGHWRFAFRTAIIGA